MTRVLAAIDNSAAASPVLVAAGALAHVLGAEVEAVHVREDGRRTAQASADRAGIPFRLITGDPRSEIVNEAADPRVVAVTVGARRAMHEHGLGHLARHIADHVDKPVLVVPPGADPPPRFRTALIAMEGTAEKARPIKSAVELAARAELDLVVLHVDDASTIPSFSDQLAHETDAYAAEFLARFVRGAPAARFEPRVGAPGEEILSAIAAIGADVVALGWPQSDDRRRGAVAREVLERSKVPVLLVAIDGLDATGGPASGSAP
jgi:nucleotide-binding universal stress UspA family protein